MGFIPVFLTELESPGEFVKDADSMAQPQKDGIRILAIALANRPTDLCQAPI